MHSYSRSAYCQALLSTSPHNNWPATRSKGLLGPSDLGPGCCPPHGDGAKSLAHPIDDGTEFLAELGWRVNPGRPLC